MLHSLTSQVFDATTFTTVTLAVFIVLNFFVRYTQTHKFGDRANPCVPTVSGATEAVLEDLDLELPEDALEAPTTPDPTPEVELPTEPVSEPVEVIEEVAERPTRRELLAIAKERKIKGYSRMSTDALWEAVLQVQ